MGQVRFATATRPPILDFAGSSTFVNEIRGAVVLAFEIHASSVESRGHVPRNVATVFISRVRVARESYAREDVIGDEFETLRCAYSFIRYRFADDECC